MKDLRPLGGNFRPSAHRIRTAAESTDSKKVSVSRQENTHSVGLARSVHPRQLKTSQGGRYMFEGMIVLATLRPSLKRSPRFGRVMSVTTLYSVSGQRAIGLSDSGSSNMSPARA